MTAGIAIGPRADDSPHRLSGYSPATRPWPRAPIVSNAAIQGRVAQNLRPTRGRVLQGGEVAMPRWPPEVHAPSGSAVLHEAGRDIGGFKKFILRGNVVDLAFRNNV